MMPSRLPHLGQVKAFEPTHPATADAEFRPCVMLQENAAAIAPPPSTRIAHQPKTTPRHVPRLTLVRQEMPMPVSTSVQMVKMSMEVAIE